jgi:Fe-S oxidoreductase
MDFLLLFVLSGVALAMIKRFRSRWFGMKKTTRQSLPDQFALISLWAIFPLRLAAESLTAGTYQNGGFLTNGIGNLLAVYLPVENMYYTFWWAYSIALGTFFVVLPFSRYMHIPTEILLIALRRAGLKTDESFTGFSWIEVNSCPRCGVCVDVCQLSSQAGIRTAPAVYLTRSIRNRRVNADRAFNCLVCGRCQEVCPVKIDISAVRISQRHLFLDNNNKNFSYLEPYPVKKAEVAYFAGCMSHLTPTILRSMKKIFAAAGVQYSFIDENGSICCGRPLQLSGAHDSARELIRANRELILASGAKTLVTSCPICYKEFVEKYDLDIEILHHTQYINRLVKQGRLQMQQEDLKVVYHDPCELGRGCGVYEEPRELLGQFAHLKGSREEKEMGLCCGGSLGNIMLTIDQKDAIRTATMNVLMESGPDVLVTACPLCKKTFSKGSAAKVRDIAEMVAAALVFPSDIQKDGLKDSVPRAHSPASPVKSPVFL